MATTAGEILGGEAPQATGGRSTVGQWIDRWVYVLMAGWFIVTALAGFVPSSIGKVMAMQAGLRPPFPAVAHFHAVLMASWLVLLFTQAWLMATGRRGPHMKLGIAAAGLVPAIWIVGVLLVIESYTGLYAARAMNLPPEARQMLEQAIAYSGNVVLSQVRTAILFPLLVGWALALRQRDPETHKRLMFLATVIPLGAALDRLIFLPTTLPAHTLSLELYTLAWIAPMFAWDLYRRGRVQKAYRIWLALYLPFAVGIWFAWDAPWVRSGVPRLFGVA